jgi:hypothetical protein
MGPGLPTPPTSESGVGNAEGPSISPAGVRWVWQRRNLDKTPPQGPSEAKAAQDGASGLPIPDRRALEKAEGR